MATVFKTFLNDDVVTARTLLHEAIPVTGSLVARTYDGPHSANSNIKNYPHGMFQSVYDYPYTSSSANHIFDLTVGLHADSSNYLPGTDSWAKKKKNVYNQMAQVLVGHDTNGDILKFDQDGDFAGSTSDKYTDALFVNIARLIGKDEVRKGTFQIRFGTGEATGQFGAAEAGGVLPTNFAANSAMPFEILDGATEPSTYITIQDQNAATDYRVNSPAGEYGILKITEIGYWTGSEYLIKNGQAMLDLFVKSPTDTFTPDALRVGLIYYQAGVVVLDPKIFMMGGDNGANKTAIDTGFIPFKGFGGDPISNLTIPAIDLNGHCDWAKDDRGSTVETSQYGNGNTEPSDWGALAAGDEIAFNGIDEALSQSTSSIEKVCNGLRNRLWDIKFNNTTELNSTIYFCRVNHNDFNYSSNPTYLGENDPATGISTGNNSKIRVKRSTLDAPVSYITTVGLYSADNELLAVAKLSEPLKKDPTNEMILRVRLDY